MCLGMFLLGFILYETLFASWTLVIISFPMLGKFSTIVSSNSFSDPFFLFFFWDSYNSNIDVFSVVPEVSETVLISLHSFFLYSVPWQWFPPFYLPATLFIHSSASVILLLIPSFISQGLRFTSCLGNKDPASYKMQTNQKKGGAQTSLSPPLSCSVDHPCCLPTLFSTYPPTLVAPLLDHLSSTHNLRNIW